MAIFLHVLHPPTTIGFSTSSSTKLFPRRNKFTRRVHCRIFDSSEVIPNFEFLDKFVFCLCLFKDTTTYTCLFGSVCDFFIFFFQFESQVKSDEGASKLKYKPGILDDFFMHSFRNKLVEVSL